MIGLVEMINTIFESRKVKQDWVVQKRSFGFEQSYRHGFVRLGRQACHHKIKGIKSGIWKGETKHTLHSRKEC